MYFFCKNSKINPGSYQIWTSNLIQIVLLPRSSSQVTTETNFDKDFRQNLSTITTRRSRNHQSSTWMNSNKDINLNGGLGGTSIGVHQHHSSNNSNHHGGHHNHHHGHHHHNQNHHGSSNSSSGGNGGGGGGGGGLGHHLSSNNNSQNNNNNSHHHHNGNGINLNGSNGHNTNSKKDSIYFNFKLYHKPSKTTPA